MKQSIGFISQVYDCWLRAKLRQCGFDNAEGQGLTQQLQAYMYKVQSHDCDCQPHENECGQTQVVLGQLSKEDANSSTLDRWKTNARTPTPFSYKSFYICRFLVTRTWVALVHHSTIVKKKTYNKHCHSTSIKSSQLGCPSYLSWKAFSNNDREYKHFQ